MWLFDSKKKADERQKIAEQKIAEERAFVQKMGKDAEKTPDIVELEGKTRHLLFVCDDVMRPHENHKLIAGKSEKIGRGFTKDPFDYRVARFTGRGLPFIDKAGLKIKGEIHAVESHAFTALDKRYANGVEFVRLRLRVLVTSKDHELLKIGNERRIYGLPPGRLITKPTLGIRHYVSDRRVDLVSAYMYVAIREFWMDQPKGSMSYAKADVKFPRENINWLPKYYKYPIDRNRCLK